MEEELENLVGAKVIGVTDTDVLFDNGYVMTIHPYETYLYKYEKEAE